MPGILRRHLSSPLHRAVFNLPLFLSSLPEKKLSLLCAAWKEWSLLCTCLWRMAEEVTSSTKAERQAHGSGTKRVYACVCTPTHTYSHTQNHARAGAKCMHTHIEKKRQEKKIVCQIQPSIFLQIQDRAFGHSAEKHKHVHDLDIIQRHVRD